MNASRLTLISHAATNAQLRAAFPLDEPVLEQEVVRIGNLKLSVPANASVWSAPERRAQDTSRILGLSPALSEELRDCDYGQWRGRNMRDLESENPEGLLAWLTDPSSAPHGGESVERLIDRVGSWMDQQRTVRHTIAATHQAIVRAAIIHALQIPTQTFWRIDVAPLTVTDLRFNGALWTVRSAGCALNKSGSAEELTPEV
jgi:broad specificity phosphatase PhoE